MSISSYSPQEIVETIRMVQMEKLDIRTITMGISLRDCASESCERLAMRIYDKVCRKGGALVDAGRLIAREYGIPVTNTRVSVTPVAIVAEGVSDLGIASMLAVAALPIPSARVSEVQAVQSCEATISKRLWSETSRQ